MYRGSELWKSTLINQNAEDQIIIDCNNYSAGGCMKKHCKIFHNLSLNVNRNFCYEHKAVLASLLRRIDDKT